MANKETYPFRNKDDLRLMYNFFTKHGMDREAHLLIIGCNVALRISDLLKLKFDDVLKPRHELREKKTNKSKTLVFNETAIKHANYLKKFYGKIGHPNPVYLFENTSSSAYGKERKPVTSNWINKRLQEAVEAVYIDYPVGTHSMRKTWGYTAYKSGMSIEQIQKTLNHSSPATTLKYIGIMQEDIENGYLNINIDV